MFPEGTKQLLFFLCDDLLLYGTEKNNHYDIRGRFFLGVC